MRSLSTIFVVLIVVSFVCVPTASAQHHEVELITPIQWDFMKSVNGFGNLEFTFAQVYSKNFNIIGAEMPDNKKKLAESKFECRFWDRFNPHSKNHGVWTISKRIDTPDSFISNYVIEFRNNHGYAVEVRKTMHPAIGEFIENYDMQQVLLYKVKTDVIYQMQADGSLKEVVADVIDPHIRTLASQGLDGYVNVKLVKQQIDARGRINFEALDNLISQSFLIIERIEDLKPGKTEKEQTQAVKEFVHKFHFSSIAVANLVKRSAKQFVKKKETVNNAAPVPPVVPEVNTTETNK